MNSKSNKTMPPAVRNIPSDQVGDVVQTFIDTDHVKELKVVQQADGTFTITPVR
jgi:hypothetical protein